MRDRPSKTETTNADVIPILENRLERLGRFKEYVFEREKLAVEAEARSFSLPSVDATDKLLRYEAHFDRQLYRAMDELERLQRRRKGENLPPPLNVNLGRRSVGLFCETKPRGCLISVAGRLIFMGQSQTRPGDGNGRCCMHGVSSTGPRTPEGLARSRRAREKDYAAEALAEQKRARELLTQSRELLKQMQAD